MSTYTNIKTLIDNNIGKSIVMCKHLMTNLLTMVKFWYYLCPTSQGTMPASMLEMPCNIVGLVGSSPAPAKIARAPVHGQGILVCTFLISLLQLQVPGLDAEWIV